MSTKCVVGVVTLSFTVLVVMVSLNVVRDKTNVRNVPDVITRRLPHVTPAPTTPAQFIQGDFNENECPTGYMHITSDARCNQAAAALGFDYDGVQTTSTWLGACSYSTNIGEVSFSENSAGYISSFGAPVCEYQAYEEDKRCYAKHSICRGEGDDNCTIEKENIKLQELLLRGQVDGYKWLSCKHHKSDIEEKKADTICKKAQLSKECDDTYDDANATGWAVFELACCSSVLVTGPDSTINGVYAQSTTELHHGNPVYKRGDGMQIKFWSHDVPPANYWRIVDSWDTWTWSSVSAGPVGFFSCPTDTLTWNPLGVNVTCQPDSA